MNTGSAKHRLQRAPEERTEGALGTKRKTLVEKATQASEQSWPGRVWGTRKRREHRMTFGPVLCSAPGGGRQY